MLNTIRKLSLKQPSSVIKPSNPAPHTPVMVDEVLHYLLQENSPKISTFLDMTFGAGGHSRKLLESAPNCRILALDRDPLAHSYAKKLAEEYPERVTPLLGRFSELATLLCEHKFGKSSIDGVLFDFGCSSMQFDSGERGFAVSKNAPLDMRMDGARFPDEPTAADVLAKATEHDLYKIIKYYGEEKYAKKIARSIIESRYLFKKLSTTQDLADLVDSVFESASSTANSSSHYHRLDKLQRPAHNATKTFQALRIFVNNELNEINYALLLSRQFLKLGGRLVAITFHSLEDTIVKRHLSGNLIDNCVPNAVPAKYSSLLYGDLGEMVASSNWVALNKSVVVPSPDEVERNPRCRSAKLRAAVRCK